MYTAPRARRRRLETPSPLSGHGTESPVPSGLHPRPEDHETVAHAVKCRSTRPQPFHDRAWCGGAQPALQAAQRATQAGRPSAAPPPAADSLHRHCVLVHARNRRGPHRRVAGTSTRSLEKTRWTISAIATTIRPQDRAASRDTSDLGDCWPLPRAPPQRRSRVVQAASTPASPKPGPDQRRRLHSLESRLAATT